MSAATHASRSGATPCRSRPKTRGDSAWLMATSSRDAARVACRSAGVDPGRSGRRRRPASLGYGPHRAGAIGNGVGFSIAPLAQPSRPMHGPGGPAAEPANVRTSEHAATAFRLEGEAASCCRRFRSPIWLPADIRIAKTTPSFRRLLPPHAYDRYAWAMVIDTAACIGCNACVVACQAENNVPVVGPGRDRRGPRHALAAHRHLRRRAGQSAGLSARACMHCEHAPCEPVCPVEASVHDGEGLNVQVYNRCIGTRFCQSNCPYKVRRFNLFGYADGQEYANLGADSSKPQSIPTSRVRAPRRHGEMHLLRPAHQPRAAHRRKARTAAIARRRSRHRLPGRLPHARDHVSATCNDRQPRRQRSCAREPQHYALLGHLGTRPRTTYLARLRNPNPALRRSAVMSVARACKRRRRCAGACRGAQSTRRSTSSSPRRC